MDFNLIDEARKILYKDGFTSEVSSIMVDESYYIGHKVETTFYKNAQTFKATAYVDNLDEVVESCENIVLLTKSLHKNYNCEIILRKPHTTTFNGHFSLASSPIDLIPESASIYTSYLELMRRGWGYSDAIGFHEGNTSHPIRKLTVSRWNWHDKNMVNPVTIHHLAPADENPQEILDMLISRSFKAWEDFPDAIPFQDAQGKMRPSFSATHRAQERDERLAKF